MRSRAIVLGSSLLLVACGGGAKQGAPTTPQAREASQPKQADAEDDGPSGPPRPSCTDGSCSLCGDGLCPKGFYCETPKRGAAACAWVPACVEKPTCACLGPFVKGCSCADESGVAHVTCR